MVISEPADYVLECGLIEQRTAIIPSEGYHALSGRRVSSGGSKVFAPSTRAGVLALALSLLLLAAFWNFSRSTQLGVKELCKMTDGSHSMRKVDSGKRRKMEGAVNGFTGGLNNNVYKTADLLSNPVPDNVLKLRGNVQISESRVDALGLSIFYREALPPQGNYAKGDILLLHGQAFSSANWLEKQTMHTFAAAGYRTIAVDLPGYGQTGGNTVAETEKPSLIKDLIVNLGLRKPVLVSPSMSGTFSLPFVLENPSLLMAFVPIAPVGTNLFQPSEFKKCIVPTLIVYGDRDTSLGILSKNNLQPLPNGRVLKIQNAGHAAYLNQPETFHSAFLNFLDLVRTYSR